MTFRCKNQTACIVLVPLFVVVVVWINQHCVVPSSVVLSFRLTSPDPGPRRLKRAQQQQQPQQEEDVVTPLLQVRINNRSSRAIMLTNNNNNNNNANTNTNAEKEEEEDEYGDVSFLDDFDVDAAIHAAAAAAAAPAAVTATSMVTATAITSAKNHNNSDNKVMNNPYTSLSASASAASTSASFSAGRQTKKLKLTTMETEHDEENLEDGSSRRSDSMRTITPPASKQPPPSQPEIIITPAERGVLQDTLTRYFGFRQYREGQLAVIQTLLRGTRDVAVFWSTGSGKSLCYQIPSLVTQKITVIVSPLISLMEDQVSKLNNALPGTPAVFLGSGQRDGPAAERRALRGEYLFVYCTPEKLTGMTRSSSSSPGSSETTDSSFLTQLAQLDLCLIAIDEAHCVSEWGHDFRPAYRRIGTVLRGGSSRNGLRPVVPIVALTATAVPRVQHDIVRNLHLRANPLIVQQSFDRSNLRISIKRKPQGGYSTAFQPYIQDWTSTATAAGISNNGSGSTIIYCPTQSMVMEVTQYLEQQLNRNNTNANATSDKTMMMKVQSYHGGQSMNHRSEAHINFLTGRTQIIVATLAFGMGIDKTDIRRIIHYGPPKTVEEYYQQIGRAGRDGRESDCIMYCNTGDFDKYKTDFYLGNLQTEQRRNIEASIDVLRTMSLSSQVCRRKALLDYFGECPAPFGDRCGTCDTCLYQSKYANDGNNGSLVRDFGPDGARLVLYAISVLNNKQGLTTIDKVISGNTKSIDSYRYSNNVRGNPDTIQQQVLDMKRQMNAYKKRVPVSYFTKELLPLLVEHKYVVMTSNQATIGGGYGGSKGRQTTWTGYELTTDKGRHGLLNTTKIMLPVPESIRDYEEEQKKKMAAKLVELQQEGIDVKQIPEEELQAGDGIVLRAMQTWLKHLNIIERRGDGTNKERLVELKALRNLVENWRMSVAAQCRIGPVDVMPDHLMLSICYAVATMKEGKLEKEVLVNAGLRSNGIDQLVVIINDWLGETMIPITSLSNNGNKGSSNNGSDDVMVLSDEPYSPSQAWEYFVYRPNKKSGLASWESSYNRFMDEMQHPQTIAMSPVNGRPIQVTTVVSHIFDGLMSGRPIDLKRLATIHPPPTREEWDALSNCEAENNTMDVTGNPKTSGRDGETFRLTDFLEPIIPQKEYADRTDEEHAIFGNWCKLLKWYMSLRRMGYNPTFTSSTTTKTENYNSNDARNNNNTDHLQC